MLSDLYSPPTSVKRPQSAIPKVQIQPPLTPAAVPVKFDPSTTQGNHYHVLRELQSMLRQRLLVDTALCRSQLFHAGVPLLFFLCAFGIGITLPRHPKMRACAAELLEDPKNHKSELMHAVLVVCAGVMMGLVFLRAVAWILVKVALSICELDLNELSSQVERDGEEFELSQRNLIVGGFFA